jgi:hypothetical protein
MDFHLKESSAQREIRALVERIPSLGPRVRQLVKEHAEGTGMVANPIHSLCLEVRDRGAIETRLPIATVGLVREQGLKDLAGTAVSSMVNNVAAVSVRAAAWLRCSSGVTGPEAVTGAGAVLAAWGRSW